MPISPRPPSGAKTNSSAFVVHRRRSGSGRAAARAGKKMSPASMARRPPSGGENEAAVGVDGLETSRDRLARRARLDLAAQARRMAEPALAQRGKSCAAAPRARSVSSIVSESTSKERAGARGRGEARQIARRIGKIVAARRRN